MWATCMCRASGFTRTRVCPTQTLACIGREKLAKLFRLSAYIHSIPALLTNSIKSRIVHVPMHHALNPDAPHHFRYVRSLHGSLRKAPRRIRSHKEETMEASCRIHCEYTTWEPLHATPIESSAVTEVRKCVLQHALQRRSVLQ